MGKERKKKKKKGGINCGFGACIAIYTFSSNFLLLLPAFLPPQGKEKPEGKFVTLEGPGGGRSMQDGTMFVGGWKKGEIR